MNTLYAFLFCLGLGVAARPLYMLVSALAKKTDLIPVTVALDFFLTALVGAAFTLYIIYTDTVLAPYLFAALGAGYFLSYTATKRVAEKLKSSKSRERKRQTD